MIEVQYKTASGVNATTYRLREKWFETGTPNVDDIQATKYNVTLTQGNRHATVSGTPAEKERLAYALLLSANLQREAITQRRAAAKK